MTMDPSFSDQHELDLTGVERARLKSCELENKDRTLGKSPGISSLGDLLRVPLGKAASL